MHGSKQNKRGKHTPGCFNFFPCSSLLFFHYFSVGPHQAPVRTGLLCATFQPPTAPLLPSAPSTMQAPGERHSEQLPQLRHRGHCCRAAQLWGQCQGDGGHRQVGRPWRCLNCQCCAPACGCKSPASMLGCTVQRRNPAARRVHQVAASCKTQQARLRAHKVCLLAQSVSALQVP